MVLQVVLWAWRPAAASAVSIVITVATRGVPSLWRRRTLASFADAFPARRGAAFAFGTTWKGADCTDSGRGRNVAAEHTFAVGGRIIRVSSEREVAGRAPAAFCVGVSNNVVSDGPFLTTPLAWLL